MSRHSTLRASDADRDHVVDRLRRAAAEGRIAAEELEHRVSAALRARTYGELHATVADLPGPRPGRSVSAPRKAGGWAVSTVRAHPALLLLIVPLMAVTAALVLAATVVWAVIIMLVVLVMGRRPGPPWVHHSRYGRYARRRVAQRPWI